MTGIAAIVSAQPHIAAKLSSMAASLSKRVHDDAGTWDDGDTGLAACTLHATSESREAELPWCNEDGSVALVLDGYVANYEELKRDLAGRGERLRNGSDAELVLRAYERWGEDCTTHLDGEFAIVVADRRRRSLFCARDHQGLRPLYYAETVDGLIVASDVATVIAGLDQIPPPNSLFLAQIAAAVIVTPEETVWKGVMRVPVASQMVFESGKCRVARHYSLPTEVTRLNRSEEDCVAEYRHMLTDAVRRASRTDRPLAFEVSGGLDSSALFAIAHSIKASGDLPATPLRGYSLRGEPNTLADELEYAREAARHVGADLAEIDLFVPGLDWFARQASVQRDIASYPNGVQSIGLERQMFADGARVAINGNGGDQWLDGSRGYVEQNLRTLRLVRLMRNASAHIADEGVGAALPKIARRAILACLPDRIRNDLRRLRTAPFEQQGHAFDCLDPRWRGAIERLLRENENSLPADPIERAKLQTFGSAWSHFANDMMNRQRALTGIEARSPMLSRRFIEFCCSLPEDMKLRGGLNRWIHRRAMQGILPENVRQRREKAEFLACREEAAIEQMLRTEAPTSFSEIVNPDALAECLDAGGTSRLAEETPFSLWGLFIVHQFLLDNSGPVG